MELNEWLDSPTKDEQHHYSEQRESSQGTRTMALCRYILKHETTPVKMTLKSGAMLSRHHPNPGKTATLMQTTTTATLHLLQNTTGSNVPVNVFNSTSAFLHSFANITIINAQYILALTSSQRREHDLNTRQSFPGIRTDMNTFDLSDYTPVKDGVDL